MHVCTIKNMLALAAEISGRRIDQEHNSTKSEFNNLIDQNYEKASYLHKCFRWFRSTYVAEQHIFLISPSILALNLI